MNSRGFTITEALITLIIIAVTASIFMMIQNSSFVRTRKSNRVLDAGQLIEKRIELTKKRIEMTGAIPTSINDTTEKGITVKCALSQANDPDGAAIAGDLVRTLTVTAKWGTTKDDSLVVTTYVTRDF